MSAMFTIATITDGRSSLRFCNTCSDVRRVALVPGDKKILES